MSLGWFVSTMGILVRPNRPLVSDGREHFAHQRVIQPAGVGNKVFSLIAGLIRLLKA